MTFEQTERAEADMVLRSYPLRLPKRKTYESKCLTSTY
jgi:hypothetical protein